MFALAASAGGGEFCARAVALLWQLISTTTIEKCVCRVRLEILICFNRAGTRTEFSWRLKALGCHMLAASTLATSICSTIRGRLLVAQPR